MISRAAGTSVYLFRDTGLGEGWVRFAAGQAQAASFEAGGEVLTHEDAGMDAGEATRHALGEVCTTDALEAEILGWRRQSWYWINRRRVELEEFSTRRELDLAAHTAKSQSAKRVMGCLGFLKVFGLFRGRKAE